MHIPPHPGQFLEESYLEPFGISVRPLAENLGVAASTLARVVAERSAVSPEMALRLSRALGRSDFGDSLLNCPHWQLSKLSPLGADVN